MPGAEWAEVQPGFWRRDLDAGAWLGVKADGSRWCWIATTGEGRRAAAVPFGQCYGLASAEAARDSADAFAVGGAR